MANNKHSYDIPALLEYHGTSEVQKIVLETLQKHKTLTKTAKVLGKGKRTIQTGLANLNKKYLRDNTDAMIPEGQTLKGRTDHYKMGDDGKYVKDHFYIKTEKSKEEALKIFIEFVKEVASQVEGKAKPIPMPTVSDDDLLSFYPLPDLHFGLLVDKNDSNHDYHYDLKIAERWVKSSMKYLVDSAPSSKEAVICDLGDFLHAENSDNRTKSGHALDVDGRNPKIVRIAFEVVKQLVEMTLTKHEIVHVYSIPGNHSEQSGIFLKEYLAAWFRNEPRVIVHNHTHASQQYHRFGKNILGFSHGHELKPERSAEVMVYDNQEVFSDTLYRVFHFGHFHQNKMFETPLCTIEIHKNIIPRDAWAEGMGFRGHIGEAKSITYHKEYGHFGRNIFNIRMIKDK